MFLIRLSSRSPCTTIFKSIARFVLFILTASTHVPIKSLAPCFKKNDRFCYGVLSVWTLLWYILSECLNLEGRIMSADTKIAELLTELHQLIKQTQVSSFTVIKENILELCQVCPTNLNNLCVCSQEERSRSEHNLLNIQKTHERMQTENKSQSPCCQLFISQCSSAAVLWVLIHSDLLSCPSVSHSVPILPDQAERTVHHGQGWCWGRVQVRRGLKCWEKIMILIWLRLLWMKQKYLVYFHLHSSDSSWETCRVTFFCSFVCILTWFILFCQH